MENAVEAFKIFLGTTIFAIALAVFFRMTSLAKDTADIVFTAVDKTSLINYDVDLLDSVDQGNRIVTFQEIIPTIYRYAQEGYGVTIMNNRYQIIGRFDLDTESQVASCFWDETVSDGNYAKASEESKKKSNSIKYEMAKYLNENILEKVGVLDSEKFEMPNLEGGVTKEQLFNYVKLNSTIKSLYNSENNEVYTGWLKSNTYSNNYITQRIYCDIYGGITRFSDNNPGVEADPTNIQDIAGTHKTFFSDGLFGRCGGDGQRFVEHIVQIDNNEYIKVKINDENEEDTGLLVYGTIRKTKKRELIYVQQ